MLHRFPQGILSVSIHLLLPARPESLRWRGLPHRRRFKQFLLKLPGLAVIQGAAPKLADALRDRYVLERELGRGGMATVYLARDLKHQRPVALKVLHPELAHVVGPERFLREIQVSAQLQHPHILSVFDSGEAAGQLWFTMPYMEAGSLRQRLTREPQLRLEDAVRIALEVADALDSAHHKGVIHRDIKPENILLSTGHCMIADFGVARALDAAGGDRLTETGLALGTPAYMSPEQAAGDPRLDGRSDIYSLGTVLYEMLAGEPPFTGRSAQAIIARRFSEPVPRLRTLRDVPEAVDEVVRTALARSPADRFASGREFAEALKAAAIGPIARPKGTRLGRRIAAGAVLAAAAAFGVYRASVRVSDRALDPNLLAVAPFDVLSPSLQLWHEGLADMLSRNLDGAGPLRTVSQTVALRRWQGRADRASAETLGRRTGAGLVVFGSMVPRGGDSVSLRAAVLDGTKTSKEVEVEVSGHQARMGELADSLGFKLLQVLGRSRPIGSVRQVSLGTRSLGGLKSFLQGEQFYRKGLWDSALAHYDEAISSDSNFGLAQYRMAIVLGWNPPSAGAYRSGEDYARRAFALNHGLTPRESLLIAASSFSSQVSSAAKLEDYVGLHYQAMAALKEAVRRYPEDPEAWYALGEARYHASRPLGTAPAQVSEAFERALALDSGFAPAYEHLLQLTMWQGKLDLSRRYAARYASLDPTGENAAAVRLVLLLLDPKRAHQVETKRVMDTASIHTLFKVGVEYLGSWADSEETAVRVLRKIGEGSRRPGGDAPFVLDSLVWPQLISHALALRGHLREAYEVDRRLLLEPDASPFSWFLDPFRSLSLLGIVPDSLAAATFGRSLEPRANWERFTGRHLLGLPWWLARRDTTSLDRFATRALEVGRRGKPPKVVLRARLLGAIASAYGSLARGDSAVALHKLSAIPDTLCLGDFAGNCFYLNLTRARLLAARGEYRKATDLLDYWRWDVVDDPVFVLATLELGRLAERRGEREKAIDGYRFVSAIWRRADPELQSYVAEAHAALERLGKRAD
jgi:tetratricopeptide (TPR) repeat protein